MVAAGERKAAISAEMTPCRTGAPKDARLPNTFELCQTGIIQTSLGAILFGAFAQSELANMYTIAPADFWLSKEVGAANTSPY